MTSFAQKDLRYTFKLSGDQVFNGPNNTLVLTGLRSHTRVKSAGIPAFPTADIQIWGMIPSDMAALTALSYDTTGVQKNIVTVEANSGDGSGWSTVFAGQIKEAAPDFDSSPDVPFVIDGLLMGFDLINSAPPSSYTGTTDVAQIVSTLAAKMGLAFQNDGVSVSLENPYLPGTYAQQLRKVVAAANISLYFDAGLLAIAPAGKPRSTPVWQLSPSNGLVNYPRRTGQGYLQARALYNPAFHQGSQVQISGSDFKPANGLWNIYAVEHDLESQKPGGAWFSNLQGYNPNSPSPVAS